MLKKRIIATIFIRDGISVQSAGFGKYLPIGRPEISAAAFNSWGADEIVLVDISASLDQRLISLDIVQKVADECNVPLTVGGGVKTVEQVGLLLDSGADKVLLNTANIDENGCLEQAKKIYGRQCMVVGIDFVKQNDDLYVYDYRYGKTTHKRLIYAITEYVERGAGEFFINDVLRDGAEIGYDLQAINLVTLKSEVPIIWCGGAGKPEDFLVALKAGNVSALAAGNIFHFSEHSINIVKSYISKEIVLRQDTQAKYNDVPLTSDGRLLKQDEEILNNLRYEKLNVEVI